MEVLDIPQGEMKQKQRILHINKAPKTLCDGKNIFKWTVMVQMEHFLSLQIFYFNYLLELATKCCLLNTLATECSQSWGTYTGSGDNDNHRGRNWATVILFFNSQGKGHQL